MNTKKKRTLTGVLLLAAALLLMGLQQLGILPTEADVRAAQTAVADVASEQLSSAQTSSAELSAKATKKPKATKTPKPTAAPTSTPVPEGPIIEPQAIADYLFSHDMTLPDNFLTKKEAQALGWDSSYNYVSDAAPGMSIGGDHFGNYDGKLPTKKGRRYTECDAYYTTGKRSAYRVIFSNDGLVYYTEDHYESFTQLFPSIETNAP